MQNINIDIDTNININININREIVEVFTNRNN